MSKHEIKNPSLETEQDRALRQKRDIERLQEQLREAERRVEELKAKAQQRSLRAERAAIELERAKATRRLMQENEELKRRLLG